MAFLLRSRLFGFLLILAALPVIPSAAQAAASDGPDPDGLSVEARLRRIAEAVRGSEDWPDRPDGPIAGQEDSATCASDDLLAYVFVNGPGIGWRNGGFRNGGFRNGGFGNGGFRNGGGFRNSGGHHGGFRNGSHGFRNYW